jgi:Transposase DDE domain group 1
VSTPNSTESDAATPAMLEDNLLPFSFPTVERKKVTAAFDGGRITSDGGVMLLAAVEKELGLADRFASLIVDPRNPLLVTHSVADILRARMLAIACGYEDADDLDHLRTDPGFKLACGRLPDSGNNLCSQPTVSRWENAPSLREVVRMSYAMIDTYCASYRRAPRAVTLDVDDTLDVVHGHQQLSLFNAHYDERCFLPIHVYDTATSRPVAVLLRTGTTPSGVEIRGHLRRMVRRIRSQWPNTRLTIRGDGHYGRPEVMAWCEANGIDYTACQATRLWIVCWNRSLTKCAYVAPTHRHLSSAVTARPAMAPNPGAASDGSLPASRRPRKDWTFVTSSPTSRVAAPSGFTTACIARAVIGPRGPIPRREATAELVACREPD